MKNGSIISKNEIQVQGPESGNLTGFQREATFLLENGVIKFLSKLPNLGLEWLHYKM